MSDNNERAFPFANINDFVAALLDDVAERPVPRPAMSRFLEIQRAVADGNASVDMALDIVEIFPDKGAT